MGFYVCVTKEPPKVRIFLKQQTNPAQIYYAMYRTVCIFVPLQIKNNHKKEIANVRMRTTNINLVVN